MLSTTSNVIVTQDIPDFCVKPKSMNVSAHLVNLEGCVKILLMAISAGARLEPLETTASIMSMSASAILAVMVQHVLMELIRIPVSVFLVFKVLTAKLTLMIVLPTLVQILVSVLILLMDSSVDVLVAIMMQGVCPMSTSVQAIRVSMVEPAKMESTITSAIAFLVMVAIAAS